ncbi:MAG: putative xanthine dehydrogenase molybdenum-binding subunit XdhA [Firmicutes bacterium]|nr:putative xanthine dehydrogenase molybdenum-binding subunit XdhA [Bacillota bacterium]
MEKTVVGKSYPRLDGPAKALGAAKYVADLKMPNMLYVKVLRSPHPHARIVRIDSSKAAALPGVRAVLSGQDCQAMLGLYLIDRPIFAIDKVRFVGEPVAAVAATSLRLAAQASALIAVEYELLPPVLDLATALAKDAPLVHEKLHEYAHIHNVFFPVPHTNISNHSKIRKGDVNLGFSQSDYVYEATYRVPQMQHVPIEAHGAVAQMDMTGKVTIWSGCQSPNAVRKLAAVAFNLPEGRIRVITPQVGGGFGGKAGIGIEGMVMALAMRVAPYPVRLILEREEVFCGTAVRQGLQATIKTGYTKEGRLLAQEADLIWDGGAYTEYGVNIVRAAAYSSAGPYDIAHLKTDSYCVYTNTPVGGPFRGFGMGELHWALEQQIDAIAAKLGLDPVAIRLQNAVRDGSTNATGEVLVGVGLSKCIEGAARLIGMDDTPSERKPNHGKGLACMVKGPSTPGTAASSAFIKINEDGSINVTISSAEIGQGMQTVMAQIAAEELGLSMEMVHINTPDTDYSPYEWQTVASRITYSTGNAVQRAAREARGKLLAMASEKLESPPESLTIVRGVITRRDGIGPATSIKELALGLSLPTGAGRGGPVMGTGYFIPDGIHGMDPETGQTPKVTSHWTFGAQAAEVAVDIETGKVNVLRVSAVYDTGFVLNPLLALGQVEGGIMQGLSVALYEELQLSQGQVKNQSFVDYKIATAAELPEMLVGFVETPLDDGPYGARGFGEHTMVPTAPAIANAIFNAVGVRIVDLPITPEKVLAALRAKPK